MLDEIGAGKHNLEMGNGISTKILYFQASSLGMICDSLCSAIFTLQGTRKT